MLSKGPKYRLPQSINWKYNFKLLTDAVEDYARDWSKREKVEPDTLSEWIKSIRSLIQIRIKKLAGSMSTKGSNVLKNPDVKKTLSTLHDKYVVIPADKASNNIVFVCKNYYIECLIKELGLNNSTCNPTYTRSTLTKEEILENHKSVLPSFGINIKKEDESLPSLYWIPKLHKIPYKERYIAGSSKCSTS